MPVPTVVCDICLKPVTKRATLSLAVLGGGNGRACRTHQEVADLVDKAEKRRAEQRNRLALSAEIHSANVRLAVIIAAARLRVVCTFRHEDPELVYLQYRVQGIKEEHIAAIRKEVDKMGGPIMSVQEKSQVLGDAALMGMEHPELFR